MTTPSPTARKILEIKDMVAIVRYLNEAISMASEHSTVTSEATNALQSVSDEIHNKLLIIGDRLDEIQEALA